MVNGDETVSYGNKFFYYDWIDFNECVTVYERVYTSIFLFGSRLYARARPHLSSRSLWPQRNFSDRNFSFSTWVDALVPTVGLPQIKKLIYLSSSPCCK
jgi:hypothetical protein